MKPILLSLTALALMSGCVTTSSNERSHDKAMDVRTARRMERDARAIDARTKSYEKQGFSSAEAKNRAEIEYLKSSAGSVAGR